jgi:hypothetical protein
MINSALNRLHHDAAVTPRRGTRSGQTDVVTDIGALALGYKVLGAVILDAREVRFDEDARAAFTNQIAADAAFARGEVRTGSLRALSAAQSLGVREQTRLQTMWNDPILKNAAKAMSELGLLDTRVRTPLGAIHAPVGATDVTRLEHRIAIANNAFAFMSNKLYSDPNMTFNRSYVNSVFIRRLNPSNLPKVTLLPPI